MINMLVYDRKEKELKRLSELSSDLAAHLSDDEWKVKKLAQLGEVTAYIGGKPLLDMLLYDVTDKGAIDSLSSIRKDYRDTELLLIADAKTSPMSYMKPGIMASSLLLRPWDDSQAADILREFFMAYLEKHGTAEDGGVYVIESRDGKLRIPYEQIYYIEAREKRVYICTAKEEFGLRGTLESVMEKLPPQFVRCHRSFVVNRYKISKVMLSQNILLLMDGIDVPLSRSYKAEFKDM